MEVPPVMIYFTGIFHEINHPAIGDPPWPWKLPCASPDFPQPVQGFLHPGLHASEIEENENMPTLGWRDNSL